MMASSSKFSVGFDTSNRAPENGTVPRGNPRGIHFDIYCCTHYAGNVSLLQIVRKEGLSYCKNLTLKDVLKARHKDLPVEARVGKDPGLDVATDYDNLNVSY